MEKFNNAILEQATLNGIFNFDEIRKQVENMKLNSVLTQYEKDKAEGKIWQGKGTDTRWKFRKEDGKLIAKVSEEKLKKVYVEYYQNIGSKKATFEQAFNSWADAQSKRPTIKHGTICKYHSDYTRFLAGKPFTKKAIAEITEDDIYDFLVFTVKEENLKLQALKNLSGYIRNTFAKARREKIISVNPFDSVNMEEIKDFCYENMCQDDEEEENTKNRVLSAKEMKSLLEQLHKERLEEPLYLPNYAVEFCTMTGLRVGEVVALKWKDLKDGKVHIRRSERRISEKGKPTAYELGTTKTGKHRFFPISTDMQTLLDTLKTLQKQNGIESEFIFAGTDGRINAPVVSCYCFRITKRAFGENQSVHAIRRTVSSNLHKLGVPSATICAMLGHSEKVNELHYNYDVSELKEKMSYMTNSFTSMKTGIEIAS